MNPEQQKEKPPERIIQSIASCNEYLTLIFEFKRRLTISRPNSLVNGKGAFEFSSRERYIFSHSGWAQRFFDRFFILGNCISSISFNWESIFKNFISFLTTTPTKLPIEIPSRVEYLSNKIKYNQIQCNHFILFYFVFSFRFL